MDAEPRATVIRKVAISRSISFISLEKAVLPERLNGFATDSCEMFMLVCCTSREQFQVQCALKPNFPHTPGNMPGDAQAVGAAPQILKSLNDQISRAANV